LIQFFYDPAAVCVAIHLQSGGENWLVVRDDKKLGVRLQ